MIYLDTHVVVWMYAFGAKRLSERACQLIEDSTEVLISPMVLLEIEFLREMGKLAVAPTIIFDYLSERIGLEICRRNFHEVLWLAMQQSWTRNPFDRIITAQAALGDNLLITKDRFIHDHYPRSAW